MCNERESGLHPRPSFLTITHYKRLCKLFYSFLPFCSSNYILNADLSPLFLQMALVMTAARALCNLSPRGFAMSDIVEREVEFSNGETALISMNEPVARFSENPILTANEVNRVWRNPAHQVVTAHNAGVARLGGETIMLFRSHLRCGISVLGVARSENGIDGWRVDPEPALKPAGMRDYFAGAVDPDEQREAEGGGVEDPRIMRMGDEFAITYSAYHGSIKNRVRVSLAVTTDFRKFVRYGPVHHADMRNVAFFPESIDGRYYGLFRPNDITEGDVGGVYAQIRLGDTTDWRSGSWHIDSEPVMRTGFGPSAFSDKIGPGAPPIKTDRGWISIFHGVRTTMDGNPYVLGAALHDLENPERVMVSAVPILFPAAADCRIDEEEYCHVPNVVFCCGALAREDGVIQIYYGGNDTVMNVGVTHADVLIGLCKQCPQNPHTGALEFVV